jgi:type I site-specific restriction endonuclease
MKILTGVNWDGFAMRRTIALKLSEEEDQIVTQLNKKGVSNSELLRNALRKYFELIHESPFQDDQLKSSLHIEGHTNTGFNESFEGLKQEMQELREQMKKTQVQVESDVMILQRQMYQLPITSQIHKQISAPVNVKTVSDIHHEVDEFLKKRLQRMDLWKK